MPLVYRLQRLLWRVLRPLTVGVRAIALDADGRVLLVRHSYQEGWYLPGGGVRRRESLLEALRRELREEVGLSLEGKPELLGVYSNFVQGKSDHVAVFVVRTWSREPAESREIVESQLFALDSLPDDLSPGSRRRLAELEGRTEVDYSW